MCQEIFNETRIYDTQTLALFHPGFSFIPRLSPHVNEKYCKRRKARWGLGNEATQALHWLQYEQVYGGGGVGGVEEEGEGGSGRGGGEWERLSHTCIGVQQCSMQARLYICG